MATSLLEELIKQAEGLTPDEQLRLIVHLADRAREAFLLSKPSRQWLEICGAASYPLLGEDAQKWVSRTRHQSDKLSKGYLEQVDGNIKRKNH